jgi:hypothetical protein
MYVVINDRIWDLRDLKYISPVIAIDRNIVITNPWDTSFTSHIDKNTAFRILSAVGEEDKWEQLITGMTNEVLGYFFYLRFEYTRERIQSILCSKLYVDREVAQDNLDNISTMINREFDKLPKYII